MTETSLLVPQGELSLLDSPLTVDIRGECSLMASPFFALSDNAWTKPQGYATLRRSGACRVHRSATTSKRAERVSSPGSPKRDCNMQGRARRANNGLKAVKVPFYD